MTDTLVDEVERDLRTVIALLESLDARLDDLYRDEALFDVSDALSFARDALDHYIGDES